MTDAVLCVQTTARTSLTSLTTHLPSTKWTGSRFLEPLMKNTRFQYSVTVSVLNCEVVIWETESTFK